MTVPCDCPKSPNRAHSYNDLRNMLEDVVNELDLSEAMTEKHGPLGTPPADLVREVLTQKDRQIDLLRRGFVEVRP